MEISRSYPIYIHKYKRHQSSPGYCVHFTVRTAALAFEYSLLWAMYSTTHTKRKEDGERPRALCAPGRTFASPIPISLEFSSHRLLGNYLTPTCPMAFSTSVTQSLGHSLSLLFSIWQCTSLLCLHFLHPTSKFLCHLALLFTPEKASVLSATLKLPFASLLHPKVASSLSHRPLV